MNKSGNTGSSPRSGSTSHKSIKFVEWRRQQGIGLIEVLISALIFMGGVMGVAGMQSQAIRVTHDSIQRSQAAWMANGAAELIKVNPSGLDSSTYQNAAASVSGNRVSYCAAPPKQCIGSTCNATEMAIFDVYDLMCRNGNGIINPTITINCALGCPTGSKVTITVAWDSRGAAAGIFAERQQTDLAFRRN